MLADPAVSIPLPLETRRRWLMAAVGFVASACGGGGGSSPPPPSGLPTLPRPPVVPVDGPAWSGFGGNAQHSALGQIRTQQMRGFYWYTTIDLAPQLNANGSLTTHYGSPVITSANTVLVPVKTGATNGFRVDARVGATGDLLWSLSSDYRLPPSRWIPSFNPVLAPMSRRLYWPGAGGKLLYRDDPDAASGPGGLAVFYGIGFYNSPDQPTFDATVFINTPLTCDSIGNVYFGFVVTGANAAGLVGGGIARVGPGGFGSYVLASAASGSATFVKTATNCAPALSVDETTLYVVMNASVPAGTRAGGRLLALDANTLTTKSSTALNDPLGNPAWISDDATSSPMVGPDGDVYIGVLESAAQPHNFRGWMLHFDATLAQTKTPGSFGWDNTPSLVPRAMVPSYAGNSSYLLLTKYNNYGGAGTGDGRNRVAILDPNHFTQADPIVPAVTVMREVLTQLGPTADPEWPGGVKEWCINTAAVDPFTKSVLINSEDGTLYRWNLETDTFSERIAMNSGLLQSYTPTVIGPDGRIYSVNSAVLHSIGQ